MKCSEIKPCRRCRDSGFTLLEVLVALSILAVALGAMLQATSVQTAGASHLQEKTFAQWVALNRITELRLLSRDEAAGHGSGVEEMAGVEWAWEAAIENTPDPRVSKIIVTVSVADDPGATEIQVVGYRREPQYAAN